MLELLILILVSLAFGKIAAADERSGLIWGFVAFFICVMCTAIPLPYVNLLIAAIITFVLMTATNMFHKPRGLEKTDRPKRRSPYV